jgi:predicted PurR-regulated permease PerM
MNDPVPGPVEAPAVVDASASPTPRWPEPLRYVALVGLVLGGLGVLAFVSEIRDVLMVGFLIAFLFYGPIRRIQVVLPKRPGLAVIFMFGGAALLLGLFAWGGIQWLVSNAQSFSGGLAQTAASLEPGAARDAVSEALANLGLGGLVQWVGRLSLLRDAVGTVVGIMALLATGLFFAFFLELHLSHATGSLRTVVPRRYDDEVARLLDKLDGLWIGYLQAMVIYGVLLTVGSLVLFLLLGVPYPFTLAVFNGLITLIPSIGGLIGSFVTGAVCISLGSTRFTEMPPATFGLAVLVLHCVLVQVTYNFIALPVISRFVKLPVWAVLAGVLAALAWGNILVAFLIPPIFGSVRLIGGYVLAKAQDRDPFPGDAAPPDPPNGFFSRLFAKVPTQPA